MNIYANDREDKQCRSKVHVRLIHLVGKTDEAAESVCGRCQPSGDKDIKVLTVTSSRRLYPQ